MDNTVILSLEIGNFPFKNGYFSKRSLNCLDCEQGKHHRSGQRQMTRKSRSKSLTNITKRALISIFPSKKDKTKENLKNLKFFPAQKFRGRLFRGRKIYIFCIFVEKHKQDAKDRFKCYESILNSFTFHRTCHVTNPEVIMIPDSHHVMLIRC